MGWIRPARSRTDGRQHIRLPTFGHDGRLGSHPARQAQRWRCDVLRPGGRKYLGLRRASGSQRALWNVSLGGGGHSSSCFSETTSLVLVPWSAQKKTRLAVSLWKKHPVQTITKGTFEGDTVRHYLRPSELAVLPRAFAYLVQFWLQRCCFWFFYNFQAIFCFCWNCPKFSSYVV